MYPQSNSFGTDFKKRLNWGLPLSSPNCFNNAYYFYFLNNCCAAGITAPIVPGILPVYSLSKIISFCKFCESSLSSALKEKLTAAGEDKDAEKKQGWNGLISR